MHFGNHWVMRNRMEVIFPDSISHFRVTFEGNCFFRSTNLRSHVNFWEPLLNTKNSIFLVGLNAIRSHFDHSSCKDPWEIPVRTYLRNPWIEKIFLSSFDASSKVFVQSLEIPPINVKNCEIDVTYELFWWRVMQGFPKYAKSMKIRSEFFLEIL